MDQSMRPEWTAPSSPSRLVSRTHSTLSEKPTFSKTILSSPPPVSPDPAYISSSAASQWVSAELDDDDMSVSETALSLLNSFLDQVLFSFLSSARSTRLPQLRHAIPDVLKPRLGKEAMASADEELREYLGDGDDEELSDLYDGQEPDRDFDLELAWKLARLRCMVYTRLGDLEEEDAIEIIEREKLDERGEQSRRYSSRSNNITPAGAIFLTSIIEYLGEQALYHAGILAQTRTSNVHPHAQGASAESATSDSRPSKRIIIEEIDIRRLGFEGPLARIWRNWRRPTRSPQESFSRPTSPSDGEGFASTKESSNRHTGSTVGALPLPTIAQTINSIDPTQIPLPISENDVNEIEVPGLAQEIDDDGIAGSTETQGTEKPKRPSSMTFLPHHARQPLTPPSGYISSNVAHRSPLRPSFGRHRSQSLPTPPQSPLAIVQGSETKKGESSLSKASYSIDDEADSSKAAQTAVPESDAVAQEERSSNGHGLVIETVPARTHTPSNRQEPNASSRQTNADKMLPRPATADQVPPLAVREESTQHSNDLGSTNLSEGPQRSKIAMTETANEESDPEDLALSSADEEPNPIQHRSKQDSTFPVQTESSSYNYRAVTVPSTAQIMQHDLIVNQAVAPITTSYHQSTTADQNHLAQESLNQLEPMPQTDVPLATARDSAPLSSLARHTESEISQNSSHSTSSSKLLGYIRDDQGKPLPPVKSEDGDVQQAAPDGLSGAVNGTRYTPSNIPGVPYEVRPGTAGSHHTPAQPPSRLRLSSGDSKEAVERTSLDSEAKKKSLEFLIQGDETLHYTLTPTSARATEFPDSIRGFMSPAQDSGDLGKNAATSNEESIQHKTQQSVASIMSMNGLRSHPVIEDLTPQKSPVASAPPASPPRAATSRPGDSLTKFRHAQPRDAKVEPSTSRDLADYLRSTGPESDNQLPRALVSRPGTSASQTSSTTRGSAHQPQIGEQSRTPTKAGGQTPLRSSAPSIASGRPSSGAPSRNSGASRYVPRDAQVSKNATTSALADFIREGPPRPAGDHRIPRTVAPFRTTMDSDDLNGLMSSTDRDQLGRSSAASTQNSSAVSQSVQSSVNSYTALLDRSKKGKPGSSTNGRRTGTSMISSPSQSNAKDGMPKRKQRRVRDPYAIDDSDDDIEEVATVKPKRDEESLIDFLRNTAPQPSMTAQPVVSATSPAALRQSLQKKNSSSAIRDRIRNTTIPGLTRKNSVTATDPPAYSRGLMARAESPHLSQAGSKLDTYKPTKPTHAAHVDRVRSSRVNGAMSSSAECLPNTEQSRATRTMNTTKDESGFLAFFSRRKSVKN